MDDFPPDFATIPPPDFDRGLPKISLQDLERLRAEFPNIAESLSMPDRNILSSLLTKSFNQALTAEEGNALYNLQTMTHKIPLSGTGLGSVSMMNRLVGDNNLPAPSGSKKKSRLEALAASRERRLETTDSESEEETGSNKTRPARKMSRSWTSTKNELKEKNSVMSDDLEDNTETFVEEDDVVKVESESAKVNLSSSSADPGSSSNANTNSRSDIEREGRLFLLKYFLSAPPRLLTARC